MDLDNCARKKARRLCCRLDALIKKLGCAKAGLSHQSENLPADQGSLSQAVVAGGAQVERIRKSGPGKAADARERAQKRKNRPKAVSRFLLTAHPLQTADGGAVRAVA
ncbi:hypothetical protein [Paracidovorax konjaci]|uniref:hypothetical protein n=1 Tax=Paracidovorax konjaci TaxID=32040 RepID=UPI0011142B5D|nr:hypothetical protein [Paracidovorax konjaci]